MSQRQQLPPSFVPVASWAAPAAPTRRPGGGGGSSGGGVGLRPAPLLPGASVRRRRTPAARRPATGLGLVTAMAKIQTQSAGEHDTESAGGGGDGGTAAAHAHPLDVAVAFDRDLARAVSVQIDEDDVAGWAGPYLGGDVDKDDEEDEDDEEEDNDELDDEYVDFEEEDDEDGEDGEDNAPFLMPESVVLPSQFIRGQLNGGDKQRAPNYDRTARRRNSRAQNDYSDLDNFDHFHETDSGDPVDYQKNNLDSVDNDHDDDDDFLYYDEDISGASAVTHVENAADPASIVFGVGSFAALGLSAELCGALAEARITRPTRVQVRGIPPVLGGADVVLGAATGSGKTLAYLLPVIEAMKAAELLRHDGDPPLRVARRPRTVIIVPTRELADQVLSVAKSISHVVKFRVIGANTGPGGSGLTKLKELLSSSPVDILVTTTGRLLQLLDLRAIDLRFTRHLIIDEVDTMFDVGFGPELQKILGAARGRGDIVNKAQYIAVGATHPTAAEEMYALEFPAAKRIDVDLHVTPPGLEARFIRTTAEGKLPELVALLGECKKDGHLRGGRVIIFCNTISSSRFVDHFLSESGYTTSCVHGEIPPDRRSAEFNAFKDGKTQLLVCTDIAARGLDNLEIAHVVIFDFPTSAVDYIHRAGRTARAGATGRVTSLILKRDLGLARAIERSSKERNDALVSARHAREEETARKAREEKDRREMQRVSNEETPETVAGSSSFGTQSRFSRGNAVGTYGRSGREGGQTFTRGNSTRAGARGASIRGARPGRGGPSSGARKGGMGGAGDGRGGRGGGGGRKRSSSSGRSGQPESQRSTTEPADVKGSGAVQDVSQTAVRAGIRYPPSGRPGQVGDRGRGSSGGRGRGTRGGRGGRGGSFRGRTSSNSRGTGRQGNSYSA